MTKKNEPVVITLIKDGPLKVTGNFTINSESNATIETENVTFLCRCGKSGRLPFCDGSHKEICD